MSSALDDIPEPWRSAMEVAETYSLNELSARTGVATSTISALVYGRKVSSEKTIAAVSDALGVAPRTTREWATLARGEDQPWVPPAEANRLSLRQRNALNELIRSIAAAADTAAKDSASAPAGKSSNVRDLARPPAPDLSRVAARRGHSEGKRRRREQDDSDA